MTPQVSDGGTETSVPRPTTGRPPEPAPLPPSNQAGAGEGATPTEGLLMAGYEPPFPDQTPAGGDAPFPDQTPPPPESGGDVQSGWGKPKPPPSPPSHPKTDAEEAAEGWKRRKRTATEKVEAARRRQEEREEKDRAYRASMMAETRSASDSNRTKKKGCSGAAAIIGILGSGDSRRPGYSRIANIPLPRPPGGTMRRRPGRPQGRLHRPGIRPAIGNREQDSQRTRPDRKILLMKSRTMIAVLILMLTTGCSSFSAAEQCLKANRALQSAERDFRAGFIAPSEMDAIREKEEASMDRNCFCRVPHRKFREAKEDFQKWAIKNNNPECF